MRVIWYSLYEIADGIVRVRSILVSSVADIYKKHISFPLRNIDEV
jgi:hypothetical protein